MIKNFVFDFGNVLTKYDLYGYIERVTGDSSFTKILDYTFLSHDWKKYDAGLVSQQEMAELAKANAPERYHNAIDIILDSFENAFVQYDEMVPVLETLKANGYRTFLLSNFPVGSYEKVAEKCPILDLVDEKIVSYKIHKIKPDAEIYEYLIDTYKLCAEECLFADDWAPNIEGCKAVGIHGHVFTTAEKYKEHLKRLGVKGF